MKETIVNQNGKKSIFSTYYVINDGFIFSTKNFNIEKNFEDCLYIIKLGSNVHPRIYYSEKKNNEWIKNKAFIGDYHSLMDFIVDNKSNIICIRGFSRAVMGEFMSAINNLKGTNIQPIKFANDIERAKYLRHLITKNDRIKKLHQRLEQMDEITTEDYASEIDVEPNSVFGEERHKARQRVIKMKNRIK